MAARQAIISKHVVLPRYSLRRERESVYCAILIENGVIAEVVRLAEDTPVSPTQISEALSTYAAWNPVDYGESYVSPGLVDCNVRINSLWETAQEVTKAAVAGGVTFMLIEESLFGQAAVEADLYTDIGEVQVISALRDFYPAADVFAHKVYRYAPSSQVQSYAESFEALFVRVKERGTTLIVDGSLPEQRMLIMGSPYRHVSLLERKFGKTMDETNFNPGAYQDDSKGKSSSGSEDEDFPLLIPNRTRSGIDAFPPGPRLDSSGEGVAVPKKGVSKEMDMLPAKQQEVYPTLIENLDRVIRFHGSSAAPLSQAELLSYNASGQYVYSAEPSPDELRLSKRSVSEAPISVEPVPASPVEVQSAEAVKPLSERLRARRPASVVVTTTSHSQVAAMKEREYITHLANMPDHWEVAGLKKVLKMLRRLPCKVHFANMSSASAVNEVRAFRTSYPHLDVTIETCPHYLFFTSEEIAPGETRLKAYPPIRNKTNCNLLWELLKVNSIDVIASGHAALSPDMKFLDTGSFKRALSGVNGIGYGLQAVWTKLRMPSIDSQQVRERYIVRLADWLSLNPARVLGISSQRGSIERGKSADFVVWQPDEFASFPQAKYPELTPYQNKTLYGRIACVYIRGLLAYDQGASFSVGKKCLKSEFVS